MRLFADLSKVEEQDDGSLKVFGVASSGARDEAGEIVSPEAMKAALPGYLAFGAIREMHQPSAAGTALEVSVDDDGFTHLTAHIVDPVAVQKVKAGVYKGLSIGGKVLKRDPKDPTTITALKLVEISLVDRPCNPEASINMWKADAACDLAAPDDEDDDGDPETDALELDAMDGPRAARVAEASKALFTTLAAAKDDASMRKVGRRNSAKDLAAIQSSHDQMVGLGARCDPANCGLDHDDEDEEDDDDDDDHDLEQRGPEEDDDEDDPGLDQKHAQLADLAKLWAKLSVDRDALKAALDGVAPQLQALRTEIDLLKAQPLPPKTAGSAHALVDKSADARGVPSETPTELSLDAVQRALDAMPPQARADLLMKAAMARPIPIRA
jgi:hypothetical protein